MNGYAILGSINNLTDRQANAATITAWTTTLAGTGVTIYLAWKSKWALAALAFFVGTPIAAALTTYAAIKITK